MDTKNLRRIVVPLPLYLLAPSLLILSLACALPGSAAKAPAAGGGTSPDDRKAAPAPVTSGPVSIGQPFLICDTAVTVVGWESYVSKETDLFQPEAGNRFIAVDLVLVNLGEASVDTGWYTFTLLDAYDEEYTEAMFPEQLVHSSPLVAGLAAGERTRGKIGYEVPEEEQEFSLAVDCYNADISTRGEMTVPLGSKPQSAEAPGRFAGETAPKPLAQGTAVMVNGVEITVTDVKPFPEEALDPNNPQVPIPPEWMTLLIVEMTLENKGEEDVELFTPRNFYVQDREGVRFVVTGITKYLDDPIQGEVIMEPGEKISGQIVARASTDAGPVYFVFECGYGKDTSRAYFLTE